MIARKREDLGIPSSSRKRIVVVGGGFAGLHLVRRLKKSPYQVVLLDRMNHHTFQHLLYQVATSELEAAAIAYPLRKLQKKQRDFHYRMAAVQRVVPGINSVETDRGPLHYDYLVLACGAKTNFFGMESVARNALPMKTIDDALAIRNRILKNLEKAQFAGDAGEVKRLSTIVIAGGGPAGVETAGAVAEFKRFVMARDYPDMDCDLCTIYLIELLPRILGPMTEEASEQTRAYLEEMGVKVITGTQIENFDGEVIKTDKGTYHSQILIWTGGVSGAAVAGLGEDLVDKKGRIGADEYARVRGHENIYAIGDVARLACPDYPEGHPQLAAVAVQQGKYLAECFKALAEAREIAPFSYRDKGVMANIGRKKGIVELPGGRTFKGFVPWLGWLAVHLVYLAGIKNRIDTLITWLWFALRKDMNSRIILGKLDEQ